MRVCMYVHACVCVCTCVRACARSLSISSIIASISSPVSCQVCSPHSRGLSHTLTTQHDASHRACPSPLVRGVPIATGTVISSLEPSTDCPHPYCGERSLRKRGTPGYKAERKPRGAGIRSEGNEAESGRRGVGVTPAAGRRAGQAGGDQRVGGRGR